MLLQDIFKKPVNRPIEGVIKANDESSLRTEIEEYVITNEISREISKFFNEYLNYTNANGVWMSGFFGSGKSHLLKMLALLLENRQVDGQSTLEMFLTKTTDDAILSGNMKNVCKIPAKSILFNIALKANVINQDKDDALVSVFVKVFNEMCGYFGNQPEIAQFERDLDSRGQYEAFKSAYQDVSGKKWEKGREQTAFEKKNIAKAYGQVVGDQKAGEGILDHYRNMKFAIDDFATMVKEYIDKQEKGFRLVFFVDEVGQFIAENVNLMLSLQTIAEGLATKCRGQAWVVVTSQEDLGRILGDMNKSKANDFSRIQARFSNRIKLTSANVDEVIQRRLLEKKENSVESLEKIYFEQVNNLRTLFDFPDGAKHYKNYRDKENFIECYPFVPYQFTLFQASIQNLSKHEAFEGKHSSVGERSMLGVFQQVAMQIMDRNVGELATFDLMFEGIRNTVKSTVQWGIIQAEDHLSDKFTIQVLKALFLVKYVPEFHASVRNIAVLMIRSFDQDLAELRKQVEQALNNLESQTYITRSEGLYEYLTDEERDVERNIKDMSIDTSEIDKQLETILFDNTLKTKKIRYAETETDYPFTKKLDRQIRGREYELAINFILDSEDDTVLRGVSLEHHDLVVALPPEPRFYEEAKLYLQTEKYVQQTISTTQKEELKRILQAKISQNQERLDSLKRMASDLIGQSRMFIAGDDVDGNASDPVVRVTNGFQKLVERTYPNLSMLKGVQYTENDIARYLKRETGLFDDELTNLTEAQTAVFAFIENNWKVLGLNTNLKTLIETFEKIPYGWSIPAILCQVAMLYAYGKLEIRKGSDTLEDSQLEKAMRNTTVQPHLILTPLEMPDFEEVKKLRDFYEDMFDALPGASEPKALAKEFQASLDKYIDELKELSYQTSQFPFLSDLEPVLTKLNGIKGKSMSFYLKEMDAEQEKLQDLKEKTIDPIRSFMNSPRRGIYEEASKFLKGQKDNLEILHNDLTTTLADIINDPLCYKGNNMQKAKELHASLKAKVKELVTKEIEKAKGAINRKQAELQNMEEFKGLPLDKQKVFTNRFIERIENFELMDQVAVIRNNYSTFEKYTYLEWVNAVIKLYDELVTYVPPVGDGKTPPEEVADTPPTPSRPAISRHDVRVSYKKNRLSSRDDVDEYLKEVRTALLKEIDDGKQIIL